MEKIIDSFLEMERELDLYNKEFCGFKYWLYIRVEMYDELQKTLRKHGDAFEKTKINLKDILRVLPKFFFDKRYSINKNRGDYDVLFVCHPRRVKEGDKYESVYSDVYANAIKNSLTIEQPFRGKHVEPTKTNNILYIDKMYYVRAVYTKVACFRGRGTESLEKEILGIVNEIKRRFGCELKVSQIVKKIYYYYYRYRFTKKYWMKVLNKISTKVIVEVVYYNFEIMVLNEVAKTKSISTIELQHGLTGKGHIAYNYHCSEEIGTLPGYMFTFSEYWKKCIRVPLFPNHIIPTGFEYYNRSMICYPPKQYRQTIVFLSSGTIGKQMEGLAVGLYNLLRERNSDLHVVFKLHPGEYDLWKERYTLLSKTGIEVIDTANVHLYDIFSGAIAQVGAYSTAIYEGLGYGIRTFLMQCEDLEHVDVLIEEDIALVVEKPEDIVNNLERDGWKMTDTSYFWKTNAFEETMNHILHIAMEK